MHIKFLTHSTGSGQAAIDYLLGELDHKGEIREEVSVLRGDPQQIGTLIDSLKTVHRYTSGVIAWSPTDNPSAAEIEDVLRDFERTSFAGLTPDQYTWSAVLHREKDGSVHIHIIVPRVELTTGHSMNIASPGWKNTFDHLRDACNFEKGWARPDDPLRARLLRGPTPTQKGLLWKKGEDLRQQITKIVQQRIEAGLIFDRDDVLATLSELGEITRTGADYISVKLDGEAKAVRLRGVLYGDKFTVGALSEVAAALAGRPGGREAPDLRAAEIAHGKLEEAIERRAEYNQKRYAEAARSLGRGAQERVGQREIAPSGAGRRQGADLGQGQVVTDLASAGQRALELGPGGRGVGVELVPGEADGLSGDRDQGPDKAVNSAVLQESRRPSGLQVKKEVAHDDRARLFGHAGHAGSNGLGRQSTFPIRPVFGLPGVGAYSLATVQVASFGATRSLGSIKSFDSVHKLPRSGVDAGRQEPKRVLPDHESNQLEHRRASKSDGLRRARDGEEVANGPATDTNRAFAHRVIATAQQSAQQSAQRANALIERASAAVRNSATTAKFAVERAERAVAHLQKLTQFFTVTRTNPAELQIAAQQTPASAPQMLKKGEIEMDKVSLQMILQQAVNASKNADGLQILLKEKGIKTEFFREADSSKIAALKIKNDEKWIDSKDIDLSWQQIEARWQAAASGAGTSNIDLMRPAATKPATITSQSRASDQLKNELDTIVNGLYASSLWLASLVIRLINAILAAIQKKTGIEMPRIDVPIPPSDKPVAPIVKYPSKFVAGEEKTENACATVLDTVRQIRESIMQNKPLPKPTFKDEDVNKKIVALRDGMQEYQSDIDNSKSERARKYKNLQRELQYAKNLMSDYQRDLKAIKEKEIRESHENSIELLNKRIKDLWSEIAYVESNDYKDDEESYYETQHG